MTLKSVKELVLTLGLIATFVVRLVWDFGKDVLAEWKIIRSNR